MITKTYRIQGFDCANCAIKAEDHLNRNKNIQFASIDFLTNRLRITFKDKELDIDDILKIIKEVESDPITISEKKTLVSEKASVFNVKFFVTLARVLIGTLIIILSFTAFNNEASFWINFVLYLIGIIILSYDVIIKIFKNIYHKHNPIDEFFLIFIVSIGSFIIASIDKENHDFMESLIILMLFQIGRLMESIAINKAKESIIESIDIRCEYAHRLLRNKEIENVHPEDLLVGDKVVIKKGEIIPIDGHIISGTAILDNRTITGDLKTTTIKEGDEVHSATLIVDGEIIIEVNKKFSDSLLAKAITSIDENKRKNAEVKSFISKFAKFYTPIVLGIAILFGVIGGLITNDWSLYLLTALKMLVVSCPCAIVISVPLAYFAGIGLASKNGIIVKGSVVFDKMKKLKKIILDKAGTLTHGSFVINEIHPINIKEDELLEYIYASSCFSNNKVARAVVHGKNLKSISKEVKNFVDLDLNGSKVNYKDKLIYSGNAILMDKLGISVDNTKMSDNYIHCVVNDVYEGYVVIEDEIKEDALPMVELLNKKGVEVIVLSNDKKENVESICNKLNIKNYHYELTNEEKINYLKEEIDPNKKYTVGYLASSIDDAYSVQYCDIGIALGGTGSDLAINNSEAVITNDDPEKVYDLLEISKKVKFVSALNIIVSIGIKLAVEGLSVVGALISKPDIVPMWLAVLSDSGLTILLVINSLLLLLRKIRK